MADFTIGQVDSVAPSGPRPQAPVAKPSPVQAGAEFLSGITGSLFNSIQEGEKAQAEASKNQSLSRFSRQQAQIANAVDTGDLTSQEARMRMRANWSAAIADNPALTSEITKAHSDIIKTAGLGQVAAEGTKQEQQFFTIQQEAMKVGMVLPGMSQDEAFRGTMDFVSLTQARLENELAREELALSKAQADEKKAWVTLGTSQINREKASLELDSARAEQRQRRSLETQVSVLLPSFSRNMQRLVEQVESGEIQPYAAELEMRTLLDTVKGEVDTQGLGMSDTFLSTAKAPFQRLFDTTRGVISGEFSTEMLQDLTNNIKAQDVLTFMSNPSARATAAVSEVYGPAASTVIQLHGRTAAGEAMNNFVESTKEGGRPRDIFSGTSEGRLAYATAIRNAVGNVARGSATVNPGQRENETLNLVNNTLRSLGRFGGDLEFEEYKPLVDAFAGDEYAQYVSDTGRSGIEAQHEGRAQEVMEVFFNDEVLPLIEEKWREATVSFPGVRPGPSDARKAVEVIRPVFAGDTVTFVKTEDAPDTPAMDRAIRELNNKVSPTLRTFIRFGAHMSRHTDYQREFNDKYAGIFEGERLDTEQEQEQR